MSSFACVAVHLAVSVLLVAVRSAKGARSLAVAVSRLAIDFYRFVLIAVIG